MGWFSSSNDKSYRCLSEYFYDTCGSCSRIYPQNGRCSYVNYTHKLNEPARNCRKYDGPVDPEKRDYAELYYLMTGRRYYYILTAICEVLGINQESYFYQEIKTLIQLVRDDKSTQKEAVSYDIYGEELAKKLVSDQESVLVCQFLFTTYLMKVFMLIRDNKPEDAIESYKEMVTLLYERYQNKENYSNIIDLTGLHENNMFVKKMSY